MGKIAAAGVRLDDEPRAVTLFESIGKLHGSGAVLRMKFDLCPCMRTINGDLLHLGIEGLKIQVSVVSDARLNDGADGVIRVSVGRRSGRSAGDGGALLLAAQENGGRKQENSKYFFVHDDLTTLRHGSRLGRDRFPRALTSDIHEMRVRLRQADS